MKLELVERGGEARAVRRRQHRVAGDRDQRLAPGPSPGRLDLLGEAASSAARRTPRARRDTRLAWRPVTTPRPHAGRADRVGGERRRLREHRAAGRVEVAGEHVEHVDQPARERAVLLRAGADAAVHRGALGASASVARERRGSSPRRCRSARPRAPARSGARRLAPSSTPCHMPGRAGRDARAPRRTACAPCRAAGTRRRPGG